ncbi:putative ribonuclease H-like domain-containing protein [Tanacetum coccineum]|uniref:Ribonuclease H-like domain-containing protein n=1 Tax=Tanacetum coccineum TaxID=301880 RepID=A0ABQ5DZW8_9ASTR
MKKKDQISFDEQEAIRLQAEFDEEVRLAREKYETNVALIEKWNDIQDKIEIDYEMAQRLQAEEQEELTIEEKSKFFVQLLEARKKHFAAKRAEEKRNRPPTKAQQRSIMCTYLKNMVGWKPKDLKNNETREESSSKRAGDELEQEKAKKQKVDEDKEIAELQSLMKIVPDEEEVAIDVIHQATKPPSIIDYKIIKEGKISYFQIIRANGSSKRYSAFIQMLRNIDREDLETLWKLVKAKHGYKGPEEGYERVLWGLESVEARLLVFKKIESAYEEDIKVLKREIHLREVAITELRRKLELAQKQKDEIQLTVENFKNSSKSLSKLIDCLIVDKCKTGLGYNAVPPPYTGNFMPPKPDLSFTCLEEFTCKPVVIKPVVENSEAKTSKAKPKAVRKNNGALIIEDWVSDSEEEDVPQANIEKKTIKPSFAKIEFVKSKKQVKSPRKTTVKQGSNFEMINKACYVCGSFDHLQYDCDNHQRQFNNFQRVVKLVWNNAKRGNPQMDLQNKRVIDSGCSRHMTGNMSYLTDYKEIDGGYVAFGGNPKGGKITGRGTKASNNAGQARKETEPIKDYILLPLWIADPPFSQDPKSSPNYGSKPSSDDRKKVNDVGEKTSIELLDDPNMPALEDIVFSNDDGDVGAEADIHNLDAFMLVINAVGGKSSIKLPDDLNMPALEDIVYSDDGEDVGAEADMNNLDTFIPDEVDVYVCQPPGFEDLNFPDRLVQVYVDDIIFGSTKKSLCTKFEKMMQKKFQMSSMGELTFFLELQVKQKEDGIFISQDKYVTKILKKFGFTDVKTANTPMETQKLLLKDKDDEEVDVHLYRSMIGSLMYLTFSRPDIMFAVYSPFDLVAYTDSDYAGASLDRKSTIGGCQFLGCRLISWQCKKQTLVANYTTETEYVAALS